MRLHYKPVKASDCGRRRWVSGERHRHRAVLVSEHTGLDREIDGLGR